MFDGQFDRIEFTLANPFELEDWIDHVESLEDDRFELTYDSQVTSCRLEIENIDAVVEVSDSVLAVICNQLARTDEILSSFIEVKKTIVDSFVGE